MFLSSSFRLYPDVQHLDEQTDLKNFIRFTRVTIKIFEADEQMACIRGEKTVDQFQNQF